MKMTSVAGRPSTAIATSEAFRHRCSRAACRACRTVGLEPVLDLGDMPLADGLVPEDQLDTPDDRYPLEVAFCATCGLVQILETVDPDVLFTDDYPYYSSFSDALLRHSRANALDLIDRQKLSESSLVVELASNDGYLLKNFVERGIPVLGIDPADGPAKAAEQMGVPTLCAFFGRDLAAQLSARGRRADVIIANNVLAHVADTNGFVEGIRTLLADDGIAVIEVPYVRELIRCGEFDTIYHEHLCYFSVTALDKLFRHNGLYLNDIRRLDIHGGSLRLYVGRREDVGDIVKTMLAAEHDEGIDRAAYYRDFARRVNEIRERVQTLLSELKSRGNTLAAYGAAAKGAIMLNFIGADHGLIDFVVDRNVHKQGKYIPGVRVPIVDPGELTRRRPDYVLLLAWNFKDEILAQQDAYRRAGGRFIIPIPDPVVV